ncbi:MBL fold metallo-hydrolase [Jeotgalibacillus sp. S-D1]|uniref:MBL fold metallo-hydrolase n=1 Tax=Jeotgalibacillus sp. S-D1 TaxID=2552189 RepID=UPI001059DCFE|nr:MBL fold metallo-hydrolase [Jeotgalibacillus sp. S-D1]TDL30872.1 MBL fold metallo-hydrolase [Jeotgalibacillus sp. S-D1]
MNSYICSTCGVQYSASEKPPAHCLICEEERQYVSPKGQSWTTLAEMRESGTYRNEILFEEESLYSITTAPAFGIGQTAYLVQDKEFNLLWDCISYLDKETIAEVNQLGGINAIALSHPHYYSAQAEWAEEFNAPIYIHEDDKEWVTRPSEKIIYWSGEVLHLTDSLSLYRLGGHFKGGAVLHWKSGFNNKGILLTGDVIQVVADREWVSFMYSYPNLIPLPAGIVSRIASKTSELSFERLYNAFHRVVKEDAQQAVQRSAERYIKALEGNLFKT